MKRVLSVLLVTILLVTQLSAQQNPVWPRNWSDPTIWKAEDGKYYSLATNPHRSIVSTDLFNWEMTNTAPIDLNSWQAMSMIARQYWAPDVTMVGKQRLLYLSLYNSAEDSNIGVLREYAPGQFQFVGLITRSKDTGIIDTIDPEVVTDPTTGKVWLFFGSTGGIFRVELQADGLAVKSGSKYEHVAGVHVKDCPDRSRVFEGCYLHYRQGWWYMFVSSGFYDNYTYQLRVGRSKTLTGEFLDRDDRPMTEGNATTVLQSENGDHFYGPGHCGEIFQASDGNEYIFYHCHVAGSRRPGSRPMMLSRIQWNNQGWPEIQAPATNPQGGENKAN